MNHHANTISLCAPPTSREPATKLQVKFVELPEKPNLHETSQLCPAAGGALGKVVRQQGMNGLPWADNIQHEQNGITWHNGITSKPNESGDIYVEAKEVCL